MPISDNPRWNEELTPVISVVNKFKVGDAVLAEGQGLRILGTVAKAGKGQFARSYLIKDHIRGVCEIWIYEENLTLL